MDKQKILEMRKLGMSISEITQAVKGDFQGLTEMQVWEKVHGVVRVRKKKEKETGVVGVFSDPHLPFDHPGYLDFVKDTFRQFGVTQVVCCGDFIDYHALSRFNAEPNAYGAYMELDKALERAQAYYEAFPAVKMCIGNHDVRPDKLAASVGIGERFLKSYREIVGLPKKWELADEYVIDGVLYKHGVNCGGKDGAYNAAIRERMSTVIGHSHAFGGIKYVANARDTVFGMNVGCGIDTTAYAFAYGKHDQNRPTLGCGIVFNREKAFFVPFTDGKGV